MDYHDISPDAMRAARQAVPQVLFCQDCGRETAHNMTNPAPTCGYCGATYQDQGGRCPYCPSDGGACAMCSEEA